MIRRMILIGAMAMCSLALHAAEPHSAQWSRRLASAYFRSGQSANFVSVLSPLSARQDTNSVISFLILKAEADRVAGSNSRAIDALRKAYEKFA